MMPNRGIAARRARRSLAADGPYEEGVTRLSGHSFVLVLPTQAELGNECSVGVKISFLQIPEMPAALADH